MSLSTLLGFIGQDNLTDIILDMPEGEQMLQLLARQVCQDADRDLDSMTDWSQAIENGRDVAKQEFHGKSEPWEGAANFKSPNILEASVSFGDRAATELLRGKNILKIDITGKKTPEKEQSSKNVSEYMNWQLNYEMEDWRDRHESLLYKVAETGTLFKKTYFDPIEKINRSDLIQYPNFIVNQAVESMHDCPSFTEVMDVPRYKVTEYQRAGIWRDVDIYGNAENEDALEGSNAQQDVTEALDNEERFYEQRCLYDLDGDGYPEPYIVTVHVQSQKIVRIIPRFHANDIIVRNAEGKTGIAGRIQGDDLDIVRIKPFKDITKYEFVKSCEGFLSLGYLHILCAIVKAVNSTTNQLLDSGSLANLQGGFLARGFRKKMGNLKMKPGVWEATEISAQDLRNGVMPHQFKEPSTVLYQLREMLENQSKELTVNMDMQGILSPNAPATTTLALIQENMVPMSAIMKRIISSESEEFKRLFELNSIYIDPEEYRRVLDDDNADYKRDFDLFSLDIMPTANPEMSSRMQRLQQADVMMSQAQVIALSGGDVRPIYENWFDAIGADYMVGQVWPDPNEVSQEQAARMEQIQKQQRQQEMLVAIEVDQAERELVIKEKLAKADFALKLADLRKKESEIILNLEKAETEQVKNQIDMYTASLEGVRSAIAMIESELNAERADREDRARQSIPSDNAPRLLPVAQ